MASRFARIVRASTLVIRELPFVEASRALGSSTRYVILNHILRNGVSVITVQTGAIHITADGRIAETAAAGARTIDWAGAFLSPGWTDLHVHIWHGGTDISVRPEQAGRATGVTAMADAGSAGEGSCHGLREYVIDPNVETIRSFLNIGSIGLVCCNRVSELSDMRSIDVDRTLDVIEANRDVICGVKVRASGVIVGGWGITPAKIAKRVAEIAGLPLMVHVGEPSPLIDEGVRMDIGHGQASFCFETARMALDKGLRPWSISTDLHLRNIHGAVLDLATTASKLLAVGLPFADTIDAITTRPRETMGIAPVPGIGERAEFTLFRLDDCDQQVEDSLGNRMVLNRMLEPIATVIGNSHEPAARRTQ